MNKDLIDHYLEKSENKIKAAELLFENGFYNDCISRSYYSMFWAAKALLLIKGLNVKTHKGLITRFGLDFVKEGYIEKIQGRALRIAKEDREAADYEVDIDYTSNDAKTSIGKAKDFHEKVKQVIKNISQE